MGAPSSEKEMKQFLKRIFFDRQIIPHGYLTRKFHSLIISNLAYKKSWKKYEQTGGTPLLKSMETLRENLQKILPDNFSVHCAYSYTNPLIYNKIMELYATGISDFKIVPLYPHTSFSTVGSVKNDIECIRKNLPDVKFEIFTDYYTEKEFIEFWKTLIISAIKNNNFKKPYLLFSAHAIPQSFVECGDKYVEQIYHSAKLIAETLNLPYSVAFQSRAHGHKHWTKPNTNAELKALKIKEIEEIVIVPISFINENLETRYDLDIEIIPNARKVLGIKQICRVEISQTALKLISKLLTECVSAPTEIKSTPHSA
jgi:ferrochelatase